MTGMQEQLTKYLTDAHAIEAQALQQLRAAPDIAGGPWLNSGPLTIDGLKGRVVLVEFWTHG